MVADVFGWIGQAVTYCGDLFSQFMTLTGFALPFIIVFTMLVIWRFILAPIFPSGAVSDSIRSSYKASKKSGGK